MGQATYLAIGLNSEIDRALVGFVQHEVHGGEHQRERQDCRDKANVARGCFHYKRIGRSLTREPVAAKIALPMAGGTAISGGSPSPVGNSVLAMKLI